MTDTKAGDIDLLGHIPRYVIYRDKKARVIGYEDGMFIILDHDELTRKVRRDRLTFLPNKKTSKVIT